LNRSTLKSPHKKSGAIGAFARIAQYRGELGAVLRRTTERLIEGKVVELEGRPVQKKIPRPRRAKNEVVEHKVVELGSIKNDKKQPAARTWPANAKSLRTAATPKRAPVPARMPVKKRSSRNAYRPGLAAGVGRFEGALPRARR
jgi:hypothetical protein